MVVIRTNIAANAALIVSLAVPETAPEIRSSKPTYNAIESTIIAIYVKSNFFFSGANFFFSSDVSVSLLGDTQPLC